MEFFLSQNVQTHSGAFCYSSYLCSAEMNSMWISNFIVSPCIFQFNN